MTPIKCSMCGQQWRNDDYCPHSFDDYKLWTLKKKSSRIEFSQDGKKIKFFDKNGNLIGDYLEPYKN